MYRYKELKAPRKPEEKILKVSNDITVRKMVSY